MSRSERHVLIVIAVLLVLGSLFWILYPRKQESPKPSPLPMPVVVSSAPVVASSAPEAAAAPKPAVRHTLPLALPATTATGAPVPPALKLHKELIPKDITIVRCYYDSEIMPPNVTTGFDINGSGFSSEFEKMIKVESGVDQIRVKNLHLVTANQIHGQLEIGPGAKTAFVYPRVLIKGLPVFSAPDPFAVVRKGEVLTVFFISMEETGRAGRFRAITNLDENLVKEFHVTASTPGIQLDDIQAHLPFAMEGRLNIATGVPTGDYGLIITIAGKEVFHRIGMIRIVRPNVGRTGYVHGATAQDRFYRPGDTLQLYLQGTGLSPEDAQALDGRIDEFDMGKGSFTYLSGVQMRVTFQCPGNAPLGSYGLTVRGRANEILFQKKDLFNIVPPNWVAGVQVSPPVKVGGQSTLKVIGRDFSPEFARNFRIETDEPGLRISALRQADASTLSADIAVSSSVAPGDYWLHLSSNGRKIEPPFGSIIKVEPGL